MAEEHKYKSVQIKVPAGVSTSVKNLQKKIIPEDLTKEGLEGRPHITVLYGLDKEEGIEKIKDILSKYGSLCITLGKMSIFYGEDTGKDYDVLYTEILGRDVVKAHLILASEVPYMSTNPIFVPHMTLAYFKKGLASIYAGCPDLEGLKFDAARLELADTNEKINSFIIAGD